ncbi:MAG: nucleotidyltransferase domain-containing protein [Candidatus Caldarchaeum sp.]|nr:nucleotidyltransferase domain-containing protein [Candidatus Caldarchaeum sp.]MDW8360213.1 nucleotidyltransferase domain-containing protein [Candidatus Caldarchaeum sp.]
MTESEIEVLRKYVGRVSENIKIHAALLFGSRARKEHGPWSDYDILLIGEFEEKYLERLSKALELAASFKLPIEPHPYTLEEAVKMLERGNPTIVDSIEEGVVIYADEEFSKILQKYQEMKKAGKLQRTKTTITF